MKSIIIASLSVLLFFSCSNQQPEGNKEQISVNPNIESIDTSLNSINGNLNWNDISTFPNSVILTGMPEHRLVSIYKKTEKTNESIFSKSYSGGSDDESFEEYHFMPGINILYGYNLLNIAHYNLKTEKLNFFFDHPVLIKTLYYPCFDQDSLNKMPINRDYYLASVYDEDTNNDSLINNKDLRRFYFINSENTQQIRLVPAEYSVIRSQYDSANDVMYLFARFDDNKNGVSDTSEPIHIFWMSLKTPIVAKKLY